ncbi:MAG: hypothetical protein K6C40_11630 [Thermoguttaceae bacterium]|nr:hypothetical protein [Thermoguttaceae bacterium]
MIDAYSLCPGGTGKKIKFCCRGRLEDFRKIYKYLDVNQYTACLNYVDSLLVADPECACLLAIRCIILKAISDRENDFIETAKRFYESHPENPIAIAESAQAILIEGQKAIKTEFGDVPATQPLLQMQEREKLRQIVREAILRYEKVFYTPQPFQYEQVVLELTQISQMVMKAGFYESANAWLGLTPEMRLEPEIQEKFMKRLSQLKTSKAIPLCFRIGLKIRFAPEEVSWKEDFDRIIQESALKLRWTQAIYDLKSLASQNAEILKCSAFWYDLALLSEWLCDLDSAQNYWTEYLACDDVPFYDALEKRIRVSFFSDCPFQDEMNICKQEFPLTDAQAALEKLQAAPNFTHLENLQKPELDGEKVLAAFDVLDAPAVTSVKDLDFEEIPVVIANAVLWAATDEKPARLAVINILEGGASFVRDVIESAIQPWLVGEMTQTVARSISVTLDTILRKINLPAGLSDEKIREIKNAHCRSILLNRWINYPLGILQNHSIRSASKKPEFRAQVETVLYILRHLLEREKISTSILDELRAALDPAPLPEITAEMLPTLSPIFFDQLPAELITPETLEQVFYVSRVFNSNNIPRPILEMAAKDERYSPQLRVEILKSLWSMCPMVSQTQEIIKNGRTLCKENGLSDVFFDIMEVASSVSEGKFHTVFERIKHIRQEHSDDADAMQYVSQLSQYMYGVIQNMNPGDLSAFQQKAAFDLPGAENLTAGKPEDEPGAVSEAAPDSASDSAPGSSSAFSEEN